MKKIIKNVYDFKKGDKFKMDSGVEFEVVVSNKDQERFLAVVVNAENEEDLGKFACDFNFNGLNVKRSEDFVKSATDSDGKEYQLERKENNEITSKDMEDAIKILLNVEDNDDIYKKIENLKNAYELSKKMTLKALKNDRWTLEQKKEVIKNFKAVEESYKEFMGNIKEEKSEIENMINELEEE